MLTGCKKLGRVFQLFSALCMIAIAACLICDLALNRGFSWSLYVITGVLLLWLTASPALIWKGRRILGAMAAFTVALLPYLYLTNRITGLDWFSPLGLPIGLTLLVALWATWLLLRFAKINNWYLAGSLVFIYGVAANAVVNIFVSRFLNTRLFGISDIISLVACAAVSALLCVIGYGGLNDTPFGKPVAPAKKRQDNEKSPAEADKKQPTEETAAPEQPAESGETEGA